MSAEAVSRFARRFVIGAVIWLLIFAGMIVGAGAAYYYWDHHKAWYVGIVTVLIGLGSALGSWFVAALLSLYLEIANSLRELVESSRVTPSGGQTTSGTTQ